MSTIKTMNSKEGSSPTRGTYRHGDLRRTLLEAGIAMAREGGPDAVVLREATRQAGVVPNAASKPCSKQYVCTRCPRRPP